MFFANYSVEIEVSPDLTVYVETRLRCQEETIDDGIRVGEAPNYDTLEIDIVDSIQENLRPDVENAVLEAAYSGKVSWEKD